MQNGLISLANLNEGRASGASSSKPPNCSGACSISVRAKCAYRIKLLPTLSSVTARSSMGDLDSGTNEGQLAFEDAADAFENALGVYTRQNFPVEWAWTKRNLGMVRSRLSERSGALERRRLLLAAKGDFEDAGGFHRG